MQNLKGGKEKEEEERKNFVDIIIIVFIFCLYSKKSISVGLFFVEYYF